MYNAGYGFGNAAPNFNAGTPQQPGAQQQLMYNQQQQFGAMAPQGFPGANPQMMAAGPAGMMQNTGMPHMAANSQMQNYQQQFAGAAYGQVMPSSMTPQTFAPNNFMIAGGGMQGFPMNQSGMPQQATPQMMQRMAQAQQQQQQQHQQQTGHPAINQMTPQRPPSSAQGTPANALSSQQGQFQPPQQQSMPQGQTTTFQTPGIEALTPQTPSFPTSQAPQLIVSTGTSLPQSPAVDPRDQERFALLLDINHELLYESIQIQSSQQELKKELQAEGKLTSDRKPTEEEETLQKDYVQCMRRLQANLAYMATLADRKPDQKIASSPAYLSAPPLTLSAKLRAQPIVPEGVDPNIDTVVDRAERDQAIKELYLRLQACYPGIDPNKEPVFKQQQGIGQRPPGQPGLSQASPSTQRTPQMTNMPAPPGFGGLSS